MTPEYIAAKQRLMSLCLQRAAREFQDPNAHYADDLEYLDDEIHTAAQQLVRQGLRHSRLAGPHPSEPQFEPK